MMDNNAHFLCPVCADGLDVIELIRPHIFRNHGIRVLQHNAGFTCQVCGQVLGTFRGWTLHTLNYHAPAQLPNVPPQNMDIIADQMLDVDIGEESGGEEEGDGEENQGGVDSDSSESDDDAALAALETLHLKHAAVNMIVEMRSVPAMTRVGVSRALAGAELMLRVNNLSLREDVADFLTSIGGRNTPAAEALLSKFESTKQLKGLKSNFGQISGVSKYFYFLKPQTCFIDHRIDQRLGEDGAYHQVHVPNTYEYVSLIDILVLVSRKRNVMNYIKNLRPSEDGKLNGYIDGEQFKEHPFFQRHPDAFQIVLYGDAADPARSQGPKSGFHSVFNFFISILNLPPSLKYSLNSIFPVIMANNQDCHGDFRNVLHLLVDELRQLESEEGVVKFINGEYVTIRGTLVAVKADSEAAHKILGFLSCSARHFCRQCMISRPELHAGLVAFGERRTPELSRAQIRLINQNPAYTRQCGLRVQTCLHDLEYFRAEHNNNFDLMHDGPEGCILMLIRLCLKQFICTEGLFTVDDFNGRILAFNYGCENIQDRPTANFSVDSLQEADRVHKQLMNAAQVLVLFRTLPFLLDNTGYQIGVEEFHDHLQYLLLLLKIFELASAPSLPRDQLPYLSRLLETFRRTWYILFPTVNPINKFHHLMHLAENTASMGPQRQFWCFKEEQMNCPGKRHVRSCNNFKNPPKTAMEQAQISISKVWGTESPDVKVEIKFVKRVDVPVHTTPVAAQLNALGFNNVSVCTAVHLHGYDYRIGEFVVTKAENNILPSFGKISCIICPRRTDHVWLGIQPWTNLGLVERLNAFQVALHGDPQAHLIDVAQEVDGESFFKFTENSLILNFREDLNYGQRKEILKVISSIEICESNQQEIVETEIPLNTMVCVSSVSEGYVDEEGVLRAFTCESPASAPLVSPSIMNFAKSQESSASSILKRPEGGLKRKKSKEDLEEIAPMKILDILNKSIVGKKIVTFVKENNSLDLSNQVQLMKIIHEHVCAENGSPVNYPSSNLKIAIAKGIVTDLPELKDEGECEWASLPPEKKKNKKRGSRTSSPSESPSPAPKASQSAKRGPRSSTNSTSSSVSLGTSSEVENDDEVATQKRMISRLLPSTTNRCVISSALASTFQSRRKWIKESRPTFTDVCEEYKHMISYDGDMIIEEFCRMEPLCDERGILKLEHLVPSIVLYAQRTKPDLFKEIGDKFQDVTLQAVLFLHKSLPITLTKSTAKDDELNHIRYFKNVIEGIPSSSLLQIAPVNTCVDTYLSLESSPDRPPTPLNPYLLWLTNDKINGQLYLKIDKKSVPLGSSATTMGGKFLKALTILVFSHYINMNVKYYFAASFPELCFEIDTLKFMKAFSIHVLSKITFSAVILISSYFEE
ncbi:hypothetical protein FOCC_FOCC012635 [Frankliniella occidentalis]|nr:hypothetical protein FOCC_FOCC012635 [Frankliniella occidentalis]